MGRKDSSFSADDLIRFYQRNLTSEERAEVRKFFATEVFGGVQWFKRFGLRILEAVGRYVDIDPEMAAFVQALVDREVERKRQRLQEG